MKEKIEYMLDRPYILGPILVVKAFGIFSSIAIGFWVVHKFVFWTQGQIFMTFDI